MTDSPRFRPTNLAANSGASSTATQARAPKAAAKILRRHAIGLYECAAHAFIVAKTHPPRDNLYRIMRRLEQTPSCFGAQSLNRASGAFPGLANMETSEVAGTHLGRFRQRGN